MATPYRFLLRPRWIALHVVAIGLVIGMVNLGLWQLRRLDEKRQLNHLLDERAAAAPALLSELLANPQGPTVSDEVAEAQYRTVQVQGSFRPADEVLIRSRSYNGRPGAYVLTPLDLGDGTAIAVNRGWIPATGVVTLPPGAEAPVGPVSVTGLLLANQHRGRFGPVDPPEGKLATLGRADLDRLRQQVDVVLYPMVLQASAVGGSAATGDASGAAATTLPVLVGPPERTEGPHLAYAGQWFFFSLIGCVGYPLLLRRSARNRR